MIFFLDLNRKGIRLNLCESFECIRSASNLASSMDITADPCDNFYQFTCGHWADEHPQPDTRTNYDWFTERQERVMRQVRMFLQKNSTEDDPDPVQQIRTFYKGCMDTDTLDQLKFQPIFDFLESVGLPKVPHYFNLSGPTPEDFKFDWLTTIVQIKKKIRKDVLIGFAILPDFRNRSVNRLSIGVPARSDPFPR